MTDGASAQLAPDQRRRDELATFLRTRRAAISPEEVGLPPGGRRRTPGLRREEVAQLAAVGTTWYTWLEQGRDVRASRDVLEALARALRLSPSERTHLILLGRGEPTPGREPSTERGSPTLRRLIESLGPNPAFILGRTWDYLGWNDAATAVFGDLSSLPDTERNHAWQTFVNPARRQVVVDWERDARAVVAGLRADSARHVGDPDFCSLITGLRDTSPDFATYWERHEVYDDDDDHCELLHPDAGPLSFSRATLRPLEGSEQRLVIFSPLRGSAEKLIDLMAGTDSGSDGGGLDQGRRSRPSRTNRPPSRKRAGAL